MYTTNLSDIDVPLVPDMVNGHGLNRYTGIPDILTCEV